MIHDINVLLPFHRVDKFFFSAIESIKLSKRVKFKLILIDDTPEQSFNAKVLDMSLKDLELIQTGGLTGYGKSLSFGLNLVESNAVALQNSDDLVDPYRFYKQLSNLESFDLSITGMQNISIDGRKLSSISGEIYSMEYDPIFLLLGSYGANATWVSSKEWLLKNFFSDTFECLDWRIAMKSFPKTSIHWTPEKLYFYRKHSNQTTRNANSSPGAESQTYKQWCKLAKSFGLENNSYHVFQAIAAPWLLSKKSRIDELLLWSKNLTSLSCQNSLEIQKNISALLQRRILIAIFMSRKQYSAKYKALMYSKLNLPNLIYDLIRNVGSEENRYFRKL